MAKKRLSIRDARIIRDRNGFMTSDDMWVAEVLEDNSKGAFKINKYNLYAGPMTSQEEVDFWEERLEKLGIPYILAVIEFNEKNEVETAERGQAFFVSPNEST